MGAAEGPGMLGHGGDGAIAKTSLPDPATGGAPALRGRHGRHLVTSGGSNMSEVSSADGSPWLTRADASVVKSLPRARVGGL
jgi:hypothetical protein